MKSQHAFGHRPVARAGRDGRCMLVWEESGGQWQRTEGLEMEGGEVMV